MSIFCISHPSEEKRPPLFAGHQKIDEAFREGIIEPGQLPAAVDIKLFHGIGGGQFPQARQGRLGVVLLIGAQERRPLREEHAVGAVDAVVPRLPAFALPPA